MKIIIIGSIAAGVSLANKLAHTARSHQITVYEKSGFYSCGACGLPYYLHESLEVLNEAVQAKERELAAQGIQGRLNCEVTGIDPAAKQVRVTDHAGGQTFTDQYDQLIVAVGSSAVMPQVPGNSRMGIHSLKTVEDLIFLKEFTRTPFVRDIVILGTNYESLELAKAFLKLGRNVRMITRSPRLLPDFDREVAQKIQTELEAAGVVFCFQETVQEFTGKTFVEKIRTNRGTYACDLCLTAGNGNAHSDLLRNTGIKTAANGAIIVDADCRTNVGGIYAIGSCAERMDAGQQSRSLKFLDFEIARTGMTEESGRGRNIRTVYAEGNDRPGICPFPNRIHIKLIYDAGTRKILGAQAWGHKGVSARINAVAVAIAAGMTLEQLGNVDLVYSSADCTVWDPIQIACQTAK